MFGYDRLRDFVGPAGAVDPETARARAVGAANEAPPRVLSERAQQYALRTPAERADTVVELARLMAATHAELLHVLAASDVALDWVDDGATDMAAWLVAMCGLATPTAKEWVRVADATQTLPVLHGAYAEGQLSWDQLRPASWFVTPETDQDSAESLAGLSAAQLTRLARRCRPRTTPDANDAHAQRGLRIRADHKRGGFRYCGFLAADQGASINAALARRGRHRNSQQHHW